MSRNHKSLALYRCKYILLYVSKPFFINQLQALRHRTMPQIAEDLSRVPENRVKRRQTRGLKSGPLGVSNRRAVSRGGVLRSMRSQANHLSPLRGSERSEPF